MILPTLQVGLEKYLVLHFNEKKILNFDENDYKELYRYLVNLCQLSGVSKPTNEVLKAIVVFLRDAYPDFSTKEIESAFILAFSYKLEVDELNNYGTLNMIWISRILNAYKIQRNKAISDYLVEENKIKVKESSTKTQLEVNQYMANAVVESFEKYKTEKEFSDLGNSIFSFLNRTEILTLNSGEKESLMKRAKQSIFKRSQGSDTGMKRIITSFKNGTPVELERLEARDIAVEDFYKKLIEEKIEIKDILKKYL